MITDYDFGRIVIDGKTYTSDVLITPQGINGSWWRKSGHAVEKEDVREVMEAGPEIIVLGQGKPGRMQASDDLKKYLEEKGVRLIEEPTARAVETYNRLAEGENVVCAGFHLTC